MSFLVGKTQPAIFVFLHWDSKKKSLFFLGGAEQSKNEPNKMLTFRAGIFYFSDSSSFHSRNYRNLNSTANTNDDRSDLGSNENSKLKDEISKLNGGSLFSNLKELFNVDRNYFLLLFLVIIIVGFYVWMGIENQIRAKKAFEHNRNLGLPVEVWSGWQGLFVGVAPKADSAGVAPKAGIPPVPAPEHTENAKVVVNSPLEQFEFPPITPAAEPWQLGSQDAATPMMQGITDLHHDIFFFLILILVFVLWGLFCLKKNFSEKKRISKEIWTLRGVLLFLILGSGLLSLLSLQGLRFFPPEFPLFLKGHCDAGGAQADEFFAAEARAAQPHIPEEAPAPAPRVVIPRLEHPLLADALRMGELYRRFLVNSFGRTYTLSTLMEVLDCQMRIEKSVEAALVHDGFDPGDVLNRRHQIRGIVLYPRGTPLSLSTYISHYRNIEEFGTRGSLPYRRVLRGIRQYDLSLRRIH